MTAGNVRSIRGWLTARGVQTQIAPEGGIDALAVAGCHQVEQQPAGHGNAEACLGAGGLGRHAAALPVGGDRPEPGVDDAIEEALGAGPPLERLAVHLEEQAHVVDEAGIGDLSPVREAGFGRRHGDVRVERGHDLALALLDLVHDGHQQAVLGAEVVDEHAVAGAESGGQLAQAQVSQAVRGDVLDRGIEQALAWVHHVAAECTTWYTAGGGGAG
jgi:hypothetical protein